MKLYTIPAPAITPAAPAVQLTSELPLGTQPSPADIARLSLGAIRSHSLAYSTAVTQHACLYPVGALMVYYDAYGHAIGRSPLTWLTHPAAVATPAVHYATTDCRTFHPCPVTHHPYRICLRLSRTPRLAHIHTAILLTTPQLIPFDPGQRHHHITPSARPGCRYAITPATGPCADTPANRHRLTDALITWGMGHIAAIITHPFSADRTITIAAPPAGTHRRPSPHLAEAYIAITQMLQSARHPTLSPVRDTDLTAIPVIDTNATPTSAAADGAVVPQPRRTPSAPAAIPCTPSGSQSPPPSVPNPGRDPPA